MNVDRVDFVAASTSLPAPEPNPEPDPTPDPRPSGGAFGIDSSGNLFHVDEGWSGGFHYLCVNGNCLPGTRINGVYQRDVTAEVAVGQTVNVEFKVEDNGGQCLTGDVTVTRQPGLTGANSLLSLIHI